MPRVSVLIPAYNHARYIEAAIQSALTQTFADIELCITDDGSGDGTPDIIAGIRDDRIRFKRFEMNSGVSCALNDAIRRSTGQYLAVLNSDDIFLSDKLRMQVEFLDSHPKVGAVFGYPDFVDRNGNIIASESTYYGNVFKVEDQPREQWLRRLFLAGNCLCHPSVMIRRRCHADIGLYDERLAQVHDLDLWVRLLQKYEISILPEAVILFRILNDQGNASAPTPEITTRSQWEMAKVMRHYCFMDEESFERAFGDDLQKLGIEEGQSRASKLGRLALAVNTHWSVLLALDLLYDSIPAEGVKISDAAHIAPREFIRLTGACDLFGLSREARALAAVGELSQPRVETGRGAAVSSSPIATRRPQAWLRRWLKGPGKG